MSLSTLKGESLAPYIPSFIKEGRTLFDSVEHFIESKCPVLLSEAWLYRYYTHGRLPPAEPGYNLWYSTGKVPAFYTDIAEFYGVDVRRLMGKLMLVMSIQTLNESFVSDSVEETRSAFDNMTKRCDVRYVELSNLLPIGELSSYDRWKHEPAGASLPYKLFNNWRPEVLHAFLSDRKKPVVLVVRNDFPCTILEICQTFEATVIKHWLGKLLPVLYKDTGFDLNEASKLYRSSIATWLGVLSRHSGPQIYKELLVGEVFEQPKTFEEIKGRREREQVIQSALVRFTRELLEPAAAVRVPARRSPTPSPPRLVAIVTAEDEAEEDEEIGTGRIISMASVFFWDIVVVAMAIFLSIAASNNGSNNGTPLFANLMDGSV